MFSSPQFVVLFVFWLASGLLFHAYVGYPLLVRLLGNWLLPRPLARPKSLGGTVLLIAAHNEERVISEKVANTLRLQAEDLKVVVVSDGSTDRTDEIVQSVAGNNPRLQLIRVEERLGKNHALNCALRQLDLGPETVVVFTDANAMYQADAVLRLRERLAAGAACVIGRLVFTDEATGTARAEGLYWKYENGIKEGEGEIGRLPFGNGAIFATTVSEIGELPLDIANDFWIPMTVLGAGKPVVYERSAIAHEPAAQAGSEEFARKVRMGNRQMRGVLSVWSRIDAATRFQLISHKVIRWFGLPLLVGGAIAAGLLWTLHPIYRVVLPMLVAPFVLGGIGFAARSSGVRVPLADLAAHFLLVHCGAFCGVLEALRGKRRATWKQAASSRVAVQEKERAAAAASE